MRTCAGILALALAAGGASAGAAPREPAPLRGGALQESGLRLLVADNPPFVLDVDGERFERLRLPRLGRGGFSIAGAGGRTGVVVADEGVNARLYAVRAGLRPTPLGEGERMVPPGDGVSVWIKRRDRGRCTLRQVALDGRTLRAPRPFPCATTLYSGGSLGVVVNRTRVIDPQSGRTILTTRWGILAAAGRYLVLAGPAKRLALLDAARGTERPVPWPSILGGLEHHAPVDPTGRFVALSFAAPSWTDGRQVSDVWLLDVRNGALTQLPGMPAFVALKRTSLAWTADGRLVLLGESGDREVVAVWRPGSPRLALKALRLPERAGYSDTFAVIG